jgi:hypothetical protein
VVSKLAVYGLDVALEIVVQEPAPATLLWKSTLET